MTIQERVEMWEFDLDRWVHEPRRTPIDLIEEAALGCVRLDQNTTATEDERAEICEILASLLILAGRRMERAALIEN